jgi:hypothetical protein
MCQDGNSIRYSLNLMDRNMVKESFGFMMEAYSLENTKMAAGQRGRFMNCRQIRHTHCSKSSMITMSKN